MSAEPVPLYYTRCPVPTASGIAFQRGMFEAAFEGSDYAVRDIAALGPEHANAHYTHSIDAFFREGGGSPPVWARSRGVDSVLLGITFMEEMLGVFVRADDPAGGVPDLAGRRLALPVWPRLVFNFWRFAAHKGLVSALRAHAMTEADVHFVDLEEGWDPHERRAVERGVSVANARCEYRGQLEALLTGEVDAIFGKGPEVALLEREAEGRIRLLYDLRTSPSVADRVNNSTPRLLTTSRYLVDGHRPAVVRYLRTLVDAARWATSNPEAATAFAAHECSIDPEEVPRYLEPGFTEKFMPATDAALVASVETMKQFLLDQAFIEHDFEVGSWLAPELLEEALEVPAGVA